MRLAIPCCLCILLASYISNIHAQPMEALPRHAYWGSSFSPPTEGKAGSTVRRITPGGFAEQVGLLLGDIILKVNQMTLSSNGAHQEIFRSVTHVKGGSAVNLEILRGGMIIQKSGILPAVPLEAFPGVITEYGSVLSSYGYRTQVITTRPENAPGKMPGIFFVRWMSCDPIEKPVSPKHGVARLLEDLIIKSGYAVMRVEKPGLGDSEGPPCYDVDFNQELAAHSAAFQAFKKLPYIDSTRIIVFGQSNGGAYAPLVIGESKVAGFVVSGGWNKTWFEHDIEFKRNLYELQGNTQTEITRKMKLITAFNTEYLIHKKIPGDILAQNPQYHEIWDGEYDHQYDLPVAYMQQLQELDIPGAWSKVNVPVYSFYGEYDYVMSAADHQKIAELVNRNSPGIATYELIPQMHHSMFWFDSVQDSMNDFWGKGVYKEELSGKVIHWMKNVFKE